MAVVVVVVVVVVVFVVFCRILSYFVVVTFVCNESFFEFYIDI